MPPVPMTTRLAPTGMVASVDHLASGAGVHMLRCGGSAADAAVATSAVLAVTTQHMCGMGGDLWAVVHEGGAGGQVHALDAAGWAGSGADAGRLRDEGLRTMPFRERIESVPVPGCVDGWVALHGRFGRLPLAEVLEPARRLADAGFPASPTLAAGAPAVAQLRGAADYRRDRPLRQGDVVRRPGVARTLAAVAEGGRGAFYEGEFGEGLLALGQGEYRADDLSSPMARWVAPLRTTAWGHELWTAPPSSQGYLTLLGAAIAAGFELPDDPGDGLWAHLLVESARQAGHDRPAVLHEGARAAVDSLLSAEEVMRRRARIDVDHAGSLGTPSADGGTIHLCAVDGDRMGVSLTQSNASGWGSHLIEPSTRIFLHNRGMGFSLEPGHPAAYGPRRRPPHTLSPALVTTAGGGPLTAVLGTMGGDSQPQVLLQLLARLLAAGQGTGPAIAAGRWTLVADPPGTGFDTWRDGGRVAVSLEANAPEGWAAGLAQRGHRIVRGPAFDHGAGHAHVIRVRGDHLEGAADPRARAADCAGW